jgi:transposase
MPRIPADVSRVELDATTLAMLLDGIDVKYVRRPTPWSPPTSLPSPR